MNELVISPEGSFTQNIWDGIGGEQMDSGTWVEGHAEGHVILSKSRIVLWAVTGAGEGAVLGHPLSLSLSLWVKWLWFSFLTDLWSLPYDWNSPSSGLGSPSLPKRLVVSHQDNKPEDFLPAETLNGPSWAQYSLVMWSLSHHWECLPFRTWPS